MGFAAVDTTAIPRSPSSWVVLALPCFRLVAAVDGIETSNIIPRVARRSAQRSGFAQAPVGASASHNMRTRTSATAASQGRGRGRSGSGGGPSGSGSGSRGCAIDANFTTPASKRTTRKARKVQFPSSDGADSTSDGAESSPGGAEPASDGEPEVVVAAELSFSERMTKGIEDAKKEGRFMDLTADDDDA